MERLPLLLGISAAIAAPLAVGCGSSDNEPATGGPSGTAPSRPEPAPPARAAERRYVARANAICREVDRRVEAIPRPRDPRRLAGYLNRIVAIGRVYIGRLAALDPPPRIAATAHTAVALARQEIALLEVTARELSRSPDPAATLESYERRRDRLIDREDALWQDLGATACVDEAPAPAGSPI
jgi:hypothetical protein